MTDSVALTDGVDRLEQANAALAAGRIDDALHLATHAVDLLAAACGPDHPDTANARLTISAVHERAGEFDTARRFAVAAMNSLDLHAGCGVPEVAILRVNAMLAVGNLHRVLGDLGAAWALLGEAVIVAEDELGPDHPATAGAYNTLGIVGKFAARFDEAQAAYRRALACYERHDNQLGMAAVLHNLGGLEHERGRPEMGIAYAERGLALREAALGSGHIDVAADLGALGALFEQADRLFDAETAYRRALAVFESALGPHHYEVAVVCGNLALLLARQGKAEAAEALYRRALAGKRVALGANHPDLAVTLHNLGVLLADTGRAAEGMELLRTAESLLAARLPADHPRRVAVRTTLASFR